MRNSCLLLVVLTVSLAACSSLSKIDHRRPLSRDGWQHPQRVIDSLRVRPGEHVADIGAGEGYFTFLLADAVGPTGKVYAVEIDPDKVEKLRKKAAARGYDNVVVIYAAEDDPRLPDGQVDLVFLCNTYHHIEDRTDYFRRLRTALAEVSHVAIIDVRNNLLGRLIVPTHYRIPQAVLNAEMSGAGYRHVSSYDYLPAQSFSLFAFVPGADLQGGRPASLFQRNSTFARAER
jgi:SAM-dependent methyltransferase